MEDRTILQRRYSKKERSLITLKNILGLIVEYNPFHNGHLYHIQTSKEKTDAHIVVAVMSGSFLQRGEPAFASKWARTKMALHHDIDLVIELPYTYSTQKAEIFATGAVSLLNAIGVNRLCFGSETGEIEPFYETVHTVMEKEEEMNTYIKQAMKKGVSFPKAFAAAFKNTVSTSKTVDLSKPNNILGYHYVKAIKQLKAPIEPFTIKREKANYHDTFFKNNEQIASATAIRNQLIDTNFDFSSIANYVPDVTKKELNRERNLYGTLPHWEHYFPFLQHRILTATLDELREIYDCDEGLEYRLKKIITKVNGYQQFIEAVKTKRYTWTRLQRLFVHILLNTTKSFIKKFCIPTNPPYIRILGMSKKGREYLSSVKKNVEIPIVTRASEYEHPLLDKDILASQIHQLPFVKHISLHDEYKAIPILIDK